MAPKPPIKSKIYIQIKKEIIKKHDDVIRVNDLLQQFGYSQSTIYIIVKQKDIFKNMKVSDDFNTVQKRRDMIIESERFYVCGLEKQMKWDLISGSFICGQAKCIFDNLNQ